MRSLWIGIHRSTYASFCLMEIYSSQKTVCFFPSLSFPLLFLPRRFILPSQLASPFFPLFPHLLLFISALSNFHCPLYSLQYPFSPLSFHFISISSIITQQLSQVSVSSPFLSSLINWDGWCFSGASKDLPPFCRFFFPSIFPNFVCFLIFCFYLQTHVLSGVTGFFFSFSGKLFSFFPLILVLGWLGCREFGIQMYVRRCDYFSPFAISFQGLFFLLFPDCFIG